MNCKKTCNCGYKPVVLNLFSSTPPLSYCPLFQVPLTVKANVFIGKLNDHTSYVVGHVSACAPPEIY